MQTKLGRTDMADAAAVREAERLAALQDLRILDTSPEAHLDAVCRTAANLFRVPIAVIAFVDETRLWFKSRYGVEADCVDRTGAFCDHAIKGLPGEALVVPDLLLDERFTQAPLVTGAPHARFYAGVPFASRTGQNVGTLGLLDTVPRPDFDPQCVQRLQDLALIVQAHLRLHEAQLCHEAEIAERVRVEQRLRAARASHAMAERTARFGHWHINTIERTIAWSDGIARIFGYNASLDVLTLDRHLSFYHPDDCEAVRHRIDDAAAGRGRTEGGGYGHTSRIVRPNGEIRFVSVHGIAERDHQGRVIALYGVCLDVTELSRSEQQQRGTSELLRTTLEAMGQGLLMLGPDDRVLIHNRRAHDLLDLSDDLLFDGAPFEPIRRHQLAKGEFNTVSPLLRRWVETGGLESEPRVYERQRPNGTILEVRAMPLAGGGVVRTFTDVTRRRQSECAVQESEQRFRLLAETTTDVIIRCDLDTTRRYVSPAVKSVLGYEPDELVGTRPLDFVHPDDVAPYRAILSALQAGEIEQTVTAQRYRHKDGGWVWIEVSFKLMRDGDRGPATGYVASLRDVTDRKAAAEALRLSEERLALALDSGSDGLWDWNLATGAIELSNHWFGMLGYEVGEIEPHIRAWDHLVHPDDAEHSRRLFTEHVKGFTPTYECEYRLQKRTGDYAWTLARGKVVARDESGRALRAVGTHIDVTRRKEAERQIAHMAVHDALTGLPNRTLFWDRVAQQIASAKRYGGNFAVLACDLDRFKAVNDSFGHPAGDALLRTVAERLVAEIGDRGTVARLGGDEFAVILCGGDYPRTASLVAQRIIEVVGKPFDLDGRAASVGVSIGIAVGPQDGMDADELFKNADIALYRAKAAGRNAFRFYETGMDAAVAARTLLELDMRNAVRRGGFLLHYQPIVHLASGAVGGFEALMRWQHPLRGAVSPAEFIPVAEESGLIVALGTWALQEACREAARWPGDLRVAVNVSAVQFAQPGLEQSVVAALSSSGLPSHRLELEITESVLMGDADGAIATLHRLRALGVRIALDDFGTGYSSLSYLRRFPFDKIKIDRSFVREVAHPDTAAIIRAIVGLGKQLGASITAEGVETNDQLEGVRREGCTEVQGFLFSKPLPADGALSLVEEQNGRAAA